MFRTLKRLFLPNPLDWMLKRAAARRAKKILIGWNRGLGDIALGLYAIVHRIREFIPDAEITFLARENLQDGFSMLEGVKYIPAPWKRGEKVDVKGWARKLGLSFDLIIKAPSPTDWVRWQHGKITPRLKWNPQHESLFEKFQLDEAQYVGVQVSAETNYGLWRNWPTAKWQELFDELEKRNVKVLLFGFGAEPKFLNKNIVDLRGKTSLFELLSIVKNKCYGLVLPDSGILSMVYYLAVAFSIRLVSLWADPGHGILKQAVSSPNPELIHRPVIAQTRDLSTVSVDQVMSELFPAKPLQRCTHLNQIQLQPGIRSAAIILAGGQGSRLGFSGPKGMFPIAGKSLFQHLCERAAPNPIAIMTSPLNHEETIAFFKENDFFGCEVYFFQQDMIPFLDDEKRPMELQGPNGNGNVFRAFAKSGLKEIFAQKGIEFITVSCVDNPLSEIFSPPMVSHGYREKADAVVQCIERAKSDQSMGVLVEKKGVEIVEYTELDPSQEYKYAYSGQLTFSFDFFCKMSEIELPFHWVRKKVDERWVWKGEQFIFDVLPYAACVRAVQVPRETHYAPIKGPETVERVEELLRKRI